MSAKAGAGLRYRYLAEGAIPNAPALRLAAGARVMAVVSQDRSFMDGGRNVALPSDNIGIPTYKEMV
jgi:hypothetical protein